MKSKLILLIILTFLLNSFQISGSRVSRKNQRSKKVLIKNGKEISMSNSLLKHSPLKFLPETAKFDSLPGHINSSSIPHMKGIVVLIEGSILLINPFNHSVSGPFLSGQLTDVGQSASVTVITSDGKTGIVGSYERKKLYFIDLSNSNNPVISGELTLSLSPEDIAISPNNRYALITNGSNSSTLICSVHIPSRTLVQELDVDPVLPSSVAIAPDGRTVITADYFEGFADVFELDPKTGLLTYKYEIDIFPYAPLNVTISPKGDTVLLSCGWMEPLDLNADLIYGPAGPYVLQIRGVANVIDKGPVGMPDSEDLYISGQSIKFGLFGNKAYYLTNLIIEEAHDSFRFPASIRVFDINGPGNVIDSGTTINLTNNGPLPFGEPIGLNTLALSPNGKYLFASNKGFNLPSKDIFVIDLNSNSVIKSIPAADVGGTDFPFCIDIPPGRADVEVNKSTDILKPYLGQEVTFIITAKNYGPMDSKYIKIRDKLPDGLTFISSDTSLGDYYQKRGDWKIPNLKVNEKATLSIKTIVNKPGKITNYASLKKSTLIDLKKSNNEAFVEIKVVEKADLKVDKSVDKTTTVIGESVLYTIAVSNLGPGTAKNINIAEKLPSSINLISYILNKGTYHSQTGIWSIDSLNNNESVSLELTVKTNKDGEIINTVKINSADTYDENDKNDVSEVNIFSYVLYSPKNVSLQRESNDMVLYIEYLNKLTWESNLLNGQNLAGYRIYRKIKDRDDSTYKLISELNTSTFVYLDRDLPDTKKFTYKIVAFNNSEKEGIPVFVGN